MCMCGVLIDCWTICSGPGTLLMKNGYNESTPKHIFRVCAVGCEGRACVLPRVIVIEALIQ